MSNAHVAHCQQPDFGRTCDNFKVTKPHHLLSGNENDDNSQFDPVLHKITFLVEMLLTK